MTFVEVTENESTITVDGYSSAVGQMKEIYRDGFILIEIK